MIPHFISASLAYPSPLTVPNVKIHLPESYGCPFRCDTKGSSFNEVVIRSRREDVDNNKREERTV